MDASPRTNLDRVYRRVLALGRFSEHPDQEVGSEGLCVIKRYDGVVVRIAG
jgi:hypothetical protein